MTPKVPQLDSRKADEVSKGIIASLKELPVGQRWQGREGGVGQALVYLFGRLSELVITRLNQVPDKHFLAFLNKAGVDLLPPRPASAELTFTVAENGPEVILVPEGTQVATAKTETRPEIIFETQKDVNITPNRLIHCIAFDPRNYADCTNQATGQESGAFWAFCGQQERERMLFLSDPELFNFPDDMSRQAATITLNFEFAVRGDPAADGGWKLEWLYWDGLEWASLIKAVASVSDRTNNFSQDGEVQLERLPASLGRCLFSLELSVQADLEAGVLPAQVQKGFKDLKIALSDEVALSTEEKGRVWGINDKTQTYYIVRKPKALDVCLDGKTIACRLTGGTTRNCLPKLKSVKGSRYLKIATSRAASIDQAYNAIQTNTSFVPLNDLAKDFFPFGQRPARLDAFYLMSDEAFTKPGAAVTLEILGLAGVPPEATSPDLDTLKVEWSYYSEQEWIPLGTSTRQKSMPARLAFDDQTLAFTQGSDDQQLQYITFKVPSAGGADPPFTKTKVNDQEGYWLRAQLTEGGYNVPASVVKQGVLGNYKFNEPKTYAPLIKAMALTYKNYEMVGKPRPISLCYSKVDGMVQEHNAILAAETPAAAIFGARDEGPALYLGFAKLFPKGKLIQLLLDVEEQAETQLMPRAVIWEYWNGAAWTPLEISDDSQSLNRWGYVRFYGPEDHRKNTEFGRPAAWLRVRPHWQLPTANFGSDRKEFITEPAASKKVTLDASKSIAFTRQNIYRYHWRLVSNTRLVANAGEDRTVSTSTVTLDASKSQGAARYIWCRKEEPATIEKQGDKASPRLRTIRLNTVSALNAVTVRDEMLGTSNGKGGQVFKLANTPVDLDHVQIAVREPDRPPTAELAQLEKELRQADEEAQVQLSEERSPWVRWSLAPDFFESTSTSRHFSLDPATGEVGFGDRKRGKIPLAGRDNIKAALYRTHSGFAGNVAAGEITTLRNPSDKLADIRAVRNPEAASGGSDREAEDKVKRRGPLSLKHRHQAVTQGGFKGLASDFGNEVAWSYCLPVCSPDGLPEAGWVTVVIIPEDTTPKPVPNPTLLRRVKQYLEERALVNLTGESNRVYVKGPEYVEARVVAKIKARDATKADSVKVDVLKRLSEFLHPVKGGPERQGWELGRNVFISEVYAEIEAVPGVDHMEQVELYGSLRQRRLCLEAEYPACFDLPAGSEVSTLDKRIKLRLAETVLKEKALTTLVVYDFKVGDEVAIVAADNTILVDKLEIANLSADRITFAKPFKPPAYFFSRCDALLSRDHRLRLPLVIPDPGDEVKEVTVQDLMLGDRVGVIASDPRDPKLLPIVGIELCKSRIFVPEGHLIYSGSHDIQMILE
ncbi:MAG: putative baseplate assembly protein [Anaerolineae bacterium]|nr:putative baseplate assembly protein [Anaerolineae bacterium]